ncbi:MarR family transcriptional regulator [Umezawaea tangerina]|uniref:MarR family transcriptional regulator n=1 Tax=Umezawaea tangerina TaxID=84725 RepID=UPI000D06B107|nr:MarR family transcriptional regulator [Umezawaea tangerina]
MASPDRVLLRDRSQAAFGQRYRLEVMLAVLDAEDGFVSLSALAKYLDVTISNLQGPIRSLVALGLLTPVPHGDSRHRFYLRNPSTAWNWAEELRDQALLDMETVRPGPHLSPSSG